MKITALEYQRKYEKLGHEVHTILTSCLDLDLLRAKLDNTLMELLMDGTLLFRPLYRIKQIPDQDDYDIHFDPDHLERCFGEVNG